MIGEDQRRVMLQYLLGELSAEESEKFEDAYLNDSEIFQELVSLENDLVDRYVLNELSGVERERFERSLQSRPARREMVETARSLLACAATTESTTVPSVSSARGKERSAPGIFRAWGANVAAAAVLLAMIGGILWLFASNQKLRNEVETLRREQSMAAQTEHGLQQQIASLQSELKQRNDIQQMAQSSPDHTSVSFTLDAAVSRGNGDVPTLTIPADVSHVVLHLNLGHESHSHYNATLRTVDDRLLWKRSNVPGRLMPGGEQRISVALPSRLLAAGDYVVRVGSGTEAPQNNLAGYSFRVIRR